jgi:glycosyltransferase involved in cell wall biosynthesis
MKIGYLMQEGGPDVRQKPLTGPANHVWQIFKELQQLGHQMRLVVRYNGKIWKSDDLENFEPVIVPQFDTGLIRLIERGVRGIQSRLRLPYTNFFESLRFAAACRQELAGFNLLYERMGWMGYGGGIAARWLKIPLVLEANNGDFITELKRLGVEPHGFQRWLAIKLMKRAAHRADYIVATGDGHRHRFIGWWRVAPAKVTVVENGSEIVSLLSRRQLRSFNPAISPAEQVTVVFVGAFEPWHGILVLIPAMAKAIAKIPAIHLVLIGSGTVQQQIEQMINELHIEQHVTFTGQLNICQVAEHLAQSDIGVSPYCGWMEFSGLKLFDYKSAGLPTIASGQDGQPATLQHNQTGWIVPPCDEDALSNAIIKLAQDPNLRRRLGQAARIEAEQHHSWQHTATELEKIFSEVLL